MRIAGIQKNDIVNGPGWRLTIFVQGCNRHCPGCQNPTAQAFDGGEEMTVQELLKLVQEEPYLTGVTISGGEPFDQPEALRDLLHHLNNVWVFTGYTFNSPEVQALSDVFPQIAVLVDGEFRQKERSLDLLYRGSRNQRLIDMKKTLERGDIVLWESPTWSIIPLTTPQEELSALTPSSQQSPD